MKPLYVLADVHGHRAEMTDALRAEGLVDARGDWSGADARLWFLGDYVDRGPDGVGVIDDVRRLTAQAADAGGEAGALLGNHEAQILAARRFGRTPVPGLAEAEGFQGGWARFGGHEADLAALTADQVAWLETLPAVALVDDFLLLHSDTLRYLELGPDIEAVNAATAEALRSESAADWLAFCMVMSSRDAFRAAEPARPDDAVATLLSALGGSSVVHGHTQLSRFGFAPAEIVGAHRYADGRVLAVDGGVFEAGGRLLLTRL